MKFILACGLAFGACIFGLAVACGGSDTSGDGSGADGSTTPTPTGSTPTLDGGTAATDFDAAAPVVVDGGCGYKSTGMPLHVADGVDLCLPSTVCSSETCPPPLGDCVNGACVFKPGYDGLKTTPQAWATYYCTLSTGGCHGVTQNEFPEITASNIAKTLNIPICEADPTAPECVGIAASSPMVVGNSQVTTDPATGQPVALWGLGMTEASGLCYELTGPGGKAVVALTDRCGGYCKCKGSGYEECGPCVSAPDMAPNCPCVGNAPGLWTECCGNGCSTVQQECDWCANNNHPHFDLDTGTFNKICASAPAGSCQITSVKPIVCLPAGTWPPGGSGGGCKANEFQCPAGSPAPQQPQVPGTQCCCNFGLTPQSDGSCK